MHERMQPQPEPEDELKNRVYFKLDMPLEEFLQRREEFILDLAAALEIDPLELKLSRIFNEDVVEDGPTDEPLDEEQF